MATVLYATAQPAFAVDQHGFSVEKGCVSPVHPGGALLCSYTISNQLPTVVHETWTVKSVIDTITAPSGVHVTGEELPHLSLTFVQGSSPTPPSCNGTQTVCTLPYGTAIESANIQTYTVQAADLGTIHDLVTVIGNDKCDAESNNCSTADAPHTAPASVDVVPLPTTTTTTSPATTTTVQVLGSTVPAPTTTTTTAAAATKASLPVTGSGTFAEVILAVSLLLGGALLVVQRRRSAL
jgi:LPXTG-motif cell wall-anchored protein